MKKRAQKTKSRARAKRKFRGNEDASKRLPDVITPIETVAANVRKEEKKNREKKQKRYWDGTRQLKEVIMGELREDKLGGGLRSRARAKLTSRNGVWGARGRK